MNLFNHNHNFVNPKHVAISPGSQGFHLKKYSAYEIKLVSNILEETLDSVDRLIPVCALYIILKDVSQNQVVHTW